MAFGPLDSPLPGIGQKFDPYMYGYGQNQNYDAWRNANPQKPYTQANYNERMGWQGPEEAAIQAAKDPVAQAFKKQQELLNTMPPWLAMGDPALQGGNLPPEFQTKLNTQGLDQLRSFATGTGESPWLKLQLQNQAQEQQGMRQAATAQSASGIADLQSQLGMRGGLSSGARERTAVAGQSNLWNTLAENARQGAQTRTGLQMNEEGRRQQALQALPGMELAALQPQQQNIQNAMTTNQLANAAALERWKQQMAGQGSLSSAQVENAQR